MTRRYLPVLFFLLMAAILNYRHNSRMATWEQEDRGHEKNRSQNQKEIEEKSRKFAFPRYEDFPCIDELNFAKLRGVWEVEQHWEYGLCLYSKERDKGRVRYQHAVEIERNRLRYGNIDTSPFEPGNSATPVWDYSVIWGSHGPGTASLHENFFHQTEKHGDQQMAAVCLKNGNHDRGMYRSKEDRLVIYWIVSIINYKSSEVPMPSEIPLQPRKTWEQLLVLRRFPDENIPHIDFDFPKAATASISEITFPPRLPVKKRDENLPRFEDRIGQAAPYELQGTFDLQIQDLKKPDPGQDSGRPDRSGTTGTADPTASGIGY